MATSTSSASFPQDLVKSLEKHNASFTTLLSLIPAQYYIAPDPEVADSKWMKNKKRKTGEEIKEHKRKSKQEKLDPTNKQTTADVLLAQSADDATADTTSETPLAGPSTQLQPLPPQASISELRAKLQSRLESFRRGRGVFDEEGGSGGDVRSRDALEEERRRKRGEMRDKRRNDRKEERRKAVAEPTAKPAKTQLLVPQLPSDPTDNLSFPALSLPSKEKQRNKSGFKQLSNPAQALAHLEKHNAKLASLPEEKRKEIEEKERWAKAEERAAGGKVADQEKVLKNAVKRKEKTKAKSSKEWSERKREIEKSNAIAIKKRNDNIAKRVDAKRDKRLGVKDKGGAKKKARPGFEGKKGKGGYKGKNRDD
ncbi:hypothetical protein CI109_105002 [Kwoniella shandongensis]|uniref:Uncharacterized protein n=1 Tax=Kwoniella shandongensis TaxID=1734106 RepID=A0A5M6BYP1_9TREE|nr:uncharacterized protein CI109_004401 [Kwoniella shandongensis]KAA5527340.1 hypothetical protein CI109_004401 [Kwoniella shandongensis]